MTISADGSSGVDDESARVETMGQFHEHGWSLDLRFWKLRWSAETAALHGVDDGFSPTVFEALAFIDPPDAVTLISRASACLRDAVAFELDVGLVTARGARKRARITGVRLDDRSGHPSMLVGDMVALVVAPAHQSAEPARVAYPSSSNRPSDWDWEVFAHSVPHELGSPVAAVSAFAACLEKSESQALSPSGRLYLQGISKAALQMSGVIKALLAIAPLTSRAMRYEQADLSALAHDAAELLRATDPARRIDLDIQAEVFGLGDVDLLRQVLFNLLSNAWKFTSRRQHAQISFSAAKRGETFIYCVADNGIGFDTEKAGQLFTAFHRMHERNEFNGSGIGLAVVRRIIERHGGRVWADAEPGVGATFYFTLDAT